MSDCVKFKDLRPGDILCYRSDGDNAALLVVSIGETYRSVDTNSQKFEITYLALFGCDWSGIGTITYGITSEAAEEHEIWRAVIG